MATVVSLYVFFFNDTATTEIYTLSLHDALPISAVCSLPGRHGAQPRACRAQPDPGLLAGCRHLASAQGRVPGRDPEGRSEEHTSELQSHLNVVCLLLLEQKKT